MGSRGLRPVLAGLAVIMLCALLGACGSGSSAGGASGGGSSGSGALTIADFSPFSGPNATYGFLEQAGCAAAVKLINQQGGVMGHQLNCRIVDSRGDPADAVPAAQQMLATTSNLVAIVDADSGVLTSTVPLFDQAHVPDMSVGGDIPFDTNKYPYFWRTIPGDDVNGYALAAYVKFKTPYTKVASMFANDQAAQGNVPGLAAGAKKLGLNVPITESLAVDQQTYETEIQRMKSAGAQVLASETDPQSAGVLFGEMKQAGSLVPGVLTSGTTGTDYDKAMTAVIGAKTFTNNFVRVIQFAPSSGPAHKTWAQALKSIGNSVRGAPEDIDQIYSEIPYDNTVQIALAMLAAHSTDRTKINEFIPKVVQGSTVVHTFAEGKAALAAGKTIDFVGVEGQVSFDKYHNSQGQWGAFRPLSNKLVAVLTAKQVAQAKGQ
jgi:branched-chain amino acid transport system substrate-binding protein